MGRADGTGAGAAHARRGDPWHAAVHRGRSGYAAHPAGPCLLLRPRAPLGHPAASAAGGDDADGRTQTPRPGGLAGWILGGLLGITSTIAHAGGPAAAAYLLRFNFDKTTFQATTILTFTIVNIIKLPFYFAIGQFPVSTLSLSLVLLPFAAVGMILGVFLHRMVPQRPFFVLMEGALFVTASKLVWDDHAG